MVISIARYTQPQRHESFQSSSNGEESYPCASVEWCNPK